MFLSLLWKRSNIPTGNPERGRKVTFWIDNLALFSTVMEIFISKNSKEDPVLNVLAFH